VEDCRPEPAAWFDQVEVCCITIFTIDYLARALTVHSVSPAEAAVAPWQRPPGQSDTKFGLVLTLRYCRQPLNLVDFLAILPFYVELLLNALGQGGAMSGASVLRVMRLIRVFRVMKMPKLKACTDMFVQIIHDTLPALLIQFFMTMLMCTLLSSIIYFAESSEYTVDETIVNSLGLDAKGGYVRPTAMGLGQEPSPFQSILYTFWWFFTTATTVGYGDDYPTSTAGRFVGILTFYTGIVLLALPLTIVSQSFNKYYPDFVQEFGTAAEKQVFQKNTPGDLLLNLHQTTDELELLKEAHAQASKKRPDPANASSEATNNEAEKAEEQPTVTVGRSQEKESLASCSQELASSSTDNIPSVQEVDRKKAGGKKKSKKAKKASDAQGFAQSDLSEDRCLEESDA